jgi:hypothetical protein
MICEACRERRHGECRGGTWCDCQHKPPATEPHDDRIAGPADESAGRPDEDDAADAADAAEDDGSEPRVNWLRQG